MLVWMAAVFQKFTMKSTVFLLLLAVLTCGLSQGNENDVEEVQVETLVQPETCSVLSRMGDTLKIHYTGKLLDGKVIDSSLSVDPLVVELGRGQLLLVLSKAWLACVKGDAVLEFEVEVVSLTQQTPWQKMVTDVLPLVCLALVPTLLGLVGLYLYNKANAEKPSKKKSKDKKIKKK
ncbi:hypothetical protein F7725_017162 [Dissostichus mawsoni]|uniref:peptidylprolyl isomerase n=1 Tax=Dissostichus mawsoni TaxID=36200 RepID=A0A7J5Z5T7_DISMA|nr:hypothetical protein F7725_017162 [Dissostichus mawsoni]